MFENTSFSINDANFIVRPVIYSDYHKSYFELLKQLTYIDHEKIHDDDFNHFVDSLNPKHVVVVVENTDTHTIVGTITILIENKIIHNMGRVAHVEDLVVDKSCRGYGIGKMLIDASIDYSKSHQCYKTILDCSEINVGFYEKNGGFTEKGICMALYH